VYHEPKAMATQRMSRIGLPAGRRICAQEREGGRQRRQIARARERTHARTHARTLVYTLRVYSRNGGGADGGGV
jgi:hypothetical protein